MQRRYTVGEEIANSITHGIGILLGIVAGIILINEFFILGNTYARWSIILYIIGMLSSYVSSTCYHACAHGKRKELLRKFDHGAIYLHIAGTYSPITLVLLRDTGYWGWGLFIFVWLCALVGFIVSFVNLKEHSNLETIFFVAMGACVLVAFKPLMNTATQVGQMQIVWWLIAGGASYIIGALFYSLRKRYMHSVFHLFCLGGSMCHIMCIYYVL